MVSRDKVVCLSAAVLLAASSAAQDQPVPLFHSGNQLVEVTVIVKDRNGADLPGLKGQDFEVYDNGEKQNISVFSVNDYSSRPAGPLRPSLPPKTPEHMLSNRPVVFSESPNPPTILVIDAGNSWNVARMTWPDLVFAQKQVLRFLEQLRPNDRLGVYLMGTNRFFVLREYHQDCANLLARLAAWKRGELNERGVKYPDVWTEFAIRATESGPDLAKRIRKSQFYDYDAGPSSPVKFDSISLLEAVAAHLKYVPGRKNVIFVSATAFLPSDFQAGLLLLRHILAADVAIYAIDPGGLAPYALDASVVIPSEFRSSPGDAVGYVNGVSELNRQISLYLHSSLTQLAVSTGGQVFVDTNDILGAIRKSFADSQVSYTLGFYPTNQRNDGSFHSLKVKTPGRSDLETRYRAGYFAPAPPSIDPRIHQIELLEMVRAPLDQSGIELDASVSPAPSTGSYDLHLRIGLPGIWLRVDNGRWTGKIEILMVQRDSSGNEYEQAFQTLGLNLQQSTFEQAARDGFAYTVRFHLAPQATSAKVVVRDLNTGDAGTLTIPSEFILDVRN